MIGRPEDAGMRQTVAGEELYSTSATIREIKYLEDGSKTENDVFVPVRLTLEILPAVGDLYVTEVTWGIENGFLRTIRPGKLLKVRIDVNDGSVIYPYGNWAFRLSLIPKDESALLVDMDPYKQSL